MQKLILLIAILGAVVCVELSNKQDTISTGGPAQLLLDHINSIETDIRTEQFEHQRLYDVQHGECTEEIDHRTQAVLDGEDALKRASAHYSRCDSSLHEAKADLASVQAYITQISGNVQALTMRRDQEKQEFIVLIQDQLDPAIRSVQGAYPIIEEVTNGAIGFAEVSRHMGKTFRSLVKTGFAANMAAPLTALVALQQGITPQQAEEVKVLFQKLEDDLTSAKQNAIAVEDEREKVFQSTIAEYNALLDKLNTTESDLNVYLGEMQACLVEEEGIINSATQKIRNNKQALIYAVQMCTAFDDEYQNATNGRNNEINLLEKLKEFITEQAEIFGDYGTESTGVFENYQAQYQENLENQVSMFIQQRQNKNKEHINRLEKALTTCKGCPKK